MQKNNLKATPEIEDFGGKYQIDNPINYYFVKKYFISIGTILRSIDASSIVNALEVGAGEGHSTNIIKKLLPTKTKFEASEYVNHQVNLAKRNNPSIKIIQEDIYNLKRRDHSIDLIFALEVLEHLDYPEKALKELYRASSKYVLIGVPNEPLWRILNFTRGKYIKDFGNTPGHLNHWSTSSLIELVNQHGFKPVVVKTPLPWTQILLRKKV